MGSVLATAVSQISLTWILRWILFVSQQSIQLTNEIVSILHKRGQILEPSNNLTSNNTTRGNVDVLQLRQLLNTKTFIK